MSDRNSNPPYRPRETERYAELSDLLGDIGNELPVAQSAEGFASLDNSSLESALASVDANYPIRPREVAIAGSAATRSWQANPGSFSRATPIAAPLAPRALDAWDLRPSVNPNAETAAEAFFPDVAEEATPAIAMPEPEMLDEDAFQSVLDGLEGDILGDDEIADYAAPELADMFGSDAAEQVQPAYQAEVKPVAPSVAPIINDAETGLLAPEVAVAAAFDPMADFDAAFDDALFDDMPAEVAPAVLRGQNFVEPEFEDLDFAEPVDAPIAIDPTAMAGAGLATILGSMRANASRETQASTSQMPVAALPTVTKPAANAEPAFPDMASPYHDVPVTGSLKVPDFVVAEAVVPQRTPDFDDFEMDDFHPPRLDSKLAEPAVVPATHSEVIVHEHNKTEIQGNDFDELADVDFGNAFDDDFNPTDELASIVGSNVESDPLISAARDDGFAPMPAMPPIETPRSGRGKWIAFGALGLALVGALAIYGSSGDSVDNGAAPAIVRADNEPVRVAPENPGGTVVPNQDRVVFNEVGGGNAVPEQPQEALVDGRQEPAIAGASNGAAVKEDDRVLNGDTSAEVVANNGTAIAPRAVQTVTVRPDGTLVVNPPVEQAAAAPQAEIVPETRPEGVAGTALDVAPAQPMPEPKTAEGALAPVVEALAAEVPVVEVPVVEVPAAEVTAADAPIKDIADAKVPIRVVDIKPVTQKPKVKTNKANAKALEAVPSRPSDQPVNIVNGEAPAVPEQPAEQQAATAEPAPQADALAAGTYAIQIASTPSEEAATSTLRRLSGKFGAVLGGKDYAIQRAEVPGKGTVFRVRILAGSKEDASKLCSRYKSAGGSCFVTR